MLIIENLKNREANTEGNEHLYCYYEISLLKDLNVIKNRGFRIRFGFVIRLCLLTLGGILGFFIYCNIY